jgi:IS4 transposase
MYDIPQPPAMRMVVPCLVTVRSASDGDSIIEKIVFIRDHSSRDCLALLPTDTKLADEQVIKLYKRRWDIELFFKMTKSFLDLV